MGIVLLWSFFSSMALAQAPAEPEPSRGVLPGGKDPIEAVEEKLEESKTEEQLLREKKRAEYEAQQKKLTARVVVLQWQDSDTDYTNETLQRNIRNRIARPDAKFYPDVDMHNPGRVEPDPSVLPGEQRASPPSQNIASVLSLVEDTAAIPYNGINEIEWGIRADELRQTANNLWFIDRAELREPTFLLYAQIGRAAENSNQNTVPYYANVDNRPVNYYWYLAGVLAKETPDLLAKISDQELYQNISNYKDQLEAGVFQPQVLSFDLNGIFDGPKFVEEYSVYVNGIEQTVGSPEGLFEVDLGITDIFLKRHDGSFSLSVRYERMSVDKDLDFPRQTAHKRMGLDLIDQLMENPYECIPDLAGDIVNYLAIYAKLHPEDDIYVAVPQFGSTSPGRIFLWRWDRSRSILKRVEDNTGGFPIRFAALVSAGVAFSGAQYADPDSAAIQEQLASPPPTEGPDPKAQAAAFAPTLTPTLEGIPIDYQLRGHFNRLMMGVGISLKVGTTGQPFYDLFQTQHNDVVAPLKGDDNGINTTTPEDGGEPVVFADREIITRQRNIQRLVYALGGVMLGKDAAVGFGPRGYVRVGWYNVPHAVDLTAHLGMTPKGPAAKKEDERSGRVRLLLDVDGFGGMVIPVRDSLHVQDTGPFAAGKPLLTFGLTAGVGLTF